MTYSIDSRLASPDHPSNGGIRPSLVERHVVAVLVAVLAVACQALLERLLPGAHYPIYLAAVAFGAWYGGFLPGLLAAVVGAVGGLALPLAPPATGDGAVDLLSGIAVSWLVAFLLAARRRAERAAARTARVHALNLALGPALSAPEIARAIVSHAVEALQAGGGALALAEGDATVMLHGEGSLTTDGPGGTLLEVIGDGVPRFLITPAEGDGSQAVLPLLVGGRPIGALELRFLHRRTFPREDRAFMLILAGQGAQALERSRLYEAERGARRHAEEAGERLAFLAQASEVLASSLDYRATLAAVARLAVPHLADWCAADVVGADGRLRRLAIAHTDPAKVNEVWEMSRRYAELPGDPVPHSIASGEPHLLPEIPDQLLRAFARDPDHLERLRRFGLRSLLIVPLRARGRTLGALTFVMAESGRRYTRADLPLAQDLAGRAAVAVDNARLFAEAEQALRTRNESLALLDTVFSASPAGLAFVDRELRFARLNDAFAGVAGIAADRLLGCTAAEALGEEGERFEAPFRQVFESGEPVLDQEIRAADPRRPAGELVALASYYPVRGREGAVEWVGAVVLDITERRSADALLMRSQRMEAIAKVAGGVAHEVNNMMTVIAGFSGFLQETLEPADPRSADVAEIRKAAERAAGITRQLLAYSRQQVLQPRPLDPNRLVSGCAGVVERVAGPGIVVRVRLGEAVPLVRADPAQLEQVLVNLTLNARDAMAGRGVLAIETAAVELEGRPARPGEPEVPPGRYARISVSDTGHGMTIEIQGRAFEPFFTTKLPGEGTGLGLATVYGIVKQSGGFIWLYSEPEQGTVFKIYLPEQPGAAEPAPAAIPTAGGSTERAPGGRETVLVVEDEEAVRRMAARALAARGYRVLEAGDAAEALGAEPDWGPIDLVVTDVVMPGMGGRELGRRLAERRPGVRLLYISGYTDDEVTRRGLLDAEAPFLQKPFEPETLARRVREVLESEPH